MPSCVSCSQEIPATAAFCPRCGTPNPEVRTIPTPTEGGTIGELLTAKFVWISSDINVVRVGSDGVVTGVAPVRTTVYTGVAGRRGFVGAAVEVVAGTARRNPNRK